MQSQLIMIEGVPFTGKSTLSEFVAQQLGLNSLPAQWVNEGMMLQRYFPHVLAVLEDKQSISEALMWEDWTAFAQTVHAAPEIFVVDAACSFAAIYPLLREDRPRPAILAELKRIADVCAPLRPLVIHLTADVDRTAPASIAERGPGWQEHMVRQSDTAPYQQMRGRSGVAGAVEFLRDAQALTRLVLEDGDWQVLTLDVTSTDWDTNRRAALDFLGIAEVTVARPVVTLAMMQSYTGTYRAEDSENAGELLSIRLEQDKLALHGANMRFGTLVPETATRFHVTATRLDTELVVEEGLVQRMVLLTPDGKRHVFRRTPERESSQQP